MAWPHTGSSITISFACRYDGENYQIGMVDVCMQPYPELMDAVYETSKVLYQVKNGEKQPCGRKPQPIPMIGY